MSGDVLTKIIIVVVVEILGNRFVNYKMPLKTSLFTAFLCALFGANSVAIKISLTGVGVFTAAGLRFALAGTALLLWAKIKKIPLRLNKGQYAQIVIISMIFTVQLSCFYIGINKTTASHGVLIANILPFVVMILAHFFIPGDEMTVKKIIGIILGFIGVIFLFYDKAGAGSGSRTGDMIVLLAVLLWGSNAIYIKTIISGFNALQITLYPMIFGVPLFFLSGSMWDGAMIRTINLSVMTAIFYQSFVTAGFGFLAWNTLLKKFGPTTLHSFVFIMPVSGVIFSVLILGEPVTANLFASIIFIGTGISIVNW